MSKIAGVMSIIIGLKVLILQDFSGQWSYYYFSNNYLYIFVSLLLFYVGYLSLKYNKSNYHIIECSKCPKCKTSYNYDYLKDGLCPKCNIKTIEIDKYFEKN